MQDIDILNFFLTPNKKFKSSILRHLDRISKEIDEYLESRFIS